MASDPVVISSVSSSSSSLSSSFQRKGVLHGFCTHAIHHGAHRKHTRYRFFLYFKKGIQKKQDWSFHLLLPDGVMMGNVGHYTKGLFIIIHPFMDDTGDKPDRLPSPWLPSPLLPLLQLLTPIITHPSCLYKRFSSEPRNTINAFHRLRLMV